MKIKLDHVEKATERRGESILSQLSSFNFPVVPRSLNNEHTIQIKLELDRIIDECERLKKQYGFS